MRGMGLGAGDNFGDDRCLIEGWGSDSSENEERAAGRRRNEGTIREMLEGPERAGGGGNEPPGKDHGSCTRITHCMKK